MNLIIKLLEESNKRMDKIMTAIESGKPLSKEQREDIRIAQQECDKQIRSVNSVVSAYAVHSKNKRTLNELRRMNLMDDDTALQIGGGICSVELEHVKCPQQIRPITRAECLDRSGKKENLEECRGCDLYSVNRDSVLGPKPFVA